VLQNVRVLSIGKVISVVPAPTAATGSGEAAAKPTAAPSRNLVATLILSPADSQKLELAKSQGRISLSLRNPLDLAESADTAPITTEALDPMVSARIARARKGRTTNVAKIDLNDPKVWAEFTGDQKYVDPEKAREKARLEEEARKKKEAQIPRVIVEVFRGDKHIQESFK
jgi:pilus assembly protein CpaB